MSKDESEVNSLRVTKVSFEIVKHKYDGYVDYDGVEKIGKIEIIFDKNLHYNRHDVKDFIHGYLLRESNCLIVDNEIKYFHEIEFAWEDEEQDERR